MPSFYPPGEYDLAGFVVAAVERSRFIDGSRVRPGHVLIGLASSGLHSNGYSLVRRVVERRRIPLSRRIAEFGCTLGEELLRPTRIYVRPVLDLLAAHRVDALAHITGGGIPGNLPRVLPARCRARIRRASWTVPPVFDWLRRMGPVDSTEVDRTLNQGLGMILATPATDVDGVLSFLRRRRERAFVIGEVVRGRSGVELID
jgi:phosphoribosylformylglycinamidine cyclo-ligase